jgi:hypothetical protein
MTNNSSVSAQRPVYASIDLWQRLEAAMKEYERKTGKRVKNLNAFLVKLLEVGLKEVWRETNH